MSNKKQNDYIDRTVLKLCRKYSKDELVAHLVKRNSENDIQLGKLDAEIQHLNHQNQQQAAEIERLQNMVANNKQLNKQASIEIKKNELYQQQLQINNQLRKRNKTITETNHNLIAKLTVLEKNENTINQRSILIDYDKWCENYTFEDTKLTSEQ